MRDRWLVVFVALGCGEPPTPRYANVDQPESAPIVVDKPAVKAELQKTGVDAEAIANCGRGTGMKPDGTCEQLRLREGKFVQQVQIPEGRFVMGDPPRRYDAREAQTNVQILWPAQPPRYAEVKSFWIDLREVSRESYAECVKEGSCTEAQCPPGEDPTARTGPEMAGKLPQTCVTEPQAEAFCRWVGGRLPTAAEWEFAARGPDARPLPWGAAVKDELHGELVPVGAFPEDASYFAIRGMGTNAREWTSTPFVPDELMTPYAKDFRLPDGPLARALAEAPRSFVTKGGRTGARRAVTTVETKLGFRCAADIEADVVALKEPNQPPAIPLAYPASSKWRLFGGVAEVVDRREAQRFCENLDVTQGDESFADWVLPTLEQVQELAESFQGPGPFWTADGAAVQQGPGDVPRATDPWVALQADPGEPLAARCIHAEPGQG